MSNLTIPPPPSSLPEGYSFHSGIPPVPAYLHLRAASGLTPKTEAQAAPVAAGSWYGCFVAFTPPAKKTVDGTGNSGSGDDDDNDDDDNNNNGTQSSPVPVPVAMGRIIGDGGWYFIIADMAVLPEHQRRGLGDAVLKHLLACIKLNAPEGWTYVTLGADGAGRALYRKNGFVESAPDQVMMHLPRDWKEQQ